jgi:hypothetical protein
MWPSWFGSAFDHLICARAPFASRREFGSQWAAISCNARLNSGSLFACCRTLKSLSARRATDERPNHQRSESKCERYGARPKWVTNPQNFRSILNNGLRLDARPSPFGASSGSDPNTTHRLSMACLAAATRLKQRTRMICCVLRPKSPVFSHAPSPSGLPRSSTDNIHLVRVLLHQHKKGQKAGCALEGIFNLAVSPVKWRRLNKEGQISLDERRGIRRG